MRIDSSTVIGGPIAIQKETNPVINEVLKSELCAVEKIRKSNVEIEVNRLFCDVKTGFTKTSAVMQMELLYNNPVKGLQRTFAIKKVQINKDTGAYVVCEKAILEMLPEVVADVDKKI